MLILCPCGVPGVSFAAPNACATSAVAGLIGTSLAHCAVFSSVPPGVCSPVRARFASDAGDSDTPMMVVGAMMADGSNGCLRAPEAARGRTVIPAAGGAAAAAAAGAAAAAATVAAAPCASVSMAVAVFAMGVVEFGVCMIVSGVVLRSCSATLSPTPLPPPAVPLAAASRLMACVPSATEG